MKKAVVVGGSNGIGLAISARLMSNGYHVYILDKDETDCRIKQSWPGRHTYLPCDLLEVDPEIFLKLREDPEIEILMITAGFGRIAEFGRLHPSEIQNLMRVNAESGIRIIRYFYKRMKSREPFYCGMMGSIAGMVSSPLFSVYAASKAAVCRFVESVNIELEASGTSNRILNVSPGSIKGSRFNGGENDLAAMDGLAGCILDNLFRRSELFIPEYESVYKGVIERYRRDAHEYGLHSYQYKLESGRADIGRRMKTGYLSGTFDLFHVGHLNLLQKAKQACDYLIVGVHPNAAHKGKEAFIPFEERRRIVAACRYVDRVVPSCQEDSDAWKLYRFDRLFVGSDYKGTERFQNYEEYFRDKKVEIMYFPYTQGTSSTQIRRIILEQSKFYSGGGWMKSRQLKNSTESRVRAVDMAGCERGLAS